MYNNDELSDLKNDKRVLAHHIIQSFSPEDGLTPEQVNEIGRKTALELTGGDYQFVVATHMDKGHLHNHIIFNSVSIDGKRKFNNYYLSSLVLRKISDFLCLENGLSVIKKTNDLFRT